ncbi:hypothetical protein [Candidatus Pelagibacter communis]|nr:hypothetical protein [Candidatus Pelagibacter ubique]
MKKFSKQIILWIICWILISGSSACVSMTTGFLEGAIEHQERNSKSNKD